MNEPTAGDGGVGVAVEGLHELAVANPSFFVA